MFKSTNNNGKLIINDYTERSTVANYAVNTTIEELAKELDAIRDCEKFKEVLDYGVQRRLVTILKNKVRIQELQTKLAPEVKELSALLKETNKLNGKYYYADNLYIDTSVVSSKEEETKTQLQALVRSILESKLNLYHRYDNKRKYMLEMAEAMLILGTCDKVEDLIKALKDKFAITEEVLSNLRDPNLLESIEPKVEVQNDDDDDDDNW